MSEYPDGLPGYDRWKLRGPDEGHDDSGAEYDAEERRIEAHARPPEPDDFDGDEEAPAPMCVNHPDRASRVNLDSEELCQECADAWVRGEGMAALEREADYQAWLDTLEDPNAGIARPHL
jgi:hypothetical protein